MRTGAGPVSKPPRHTPISMLRRHTKIDDATIIRLCHGFGQGLGMEAMAGAAGVSIKTARAIALDLRARLKKPAFARWHSLNRALVWHVEPEADALIRAAFVDVLAECYGNDACYKVFRRGNRKTRFCRSCPIPSRFSTPDHAREAVGLVDGVRAFYARLRLRENGGDPVQRFRDRLIHGSVIAEVKENTRRRPDGLLDPSDVSYLALGSLLTLLLDDLIEGRDRPRETRPIVEAK